MFRRVILAAALSAVFVSAASAATVNYSARLSGRNETPKTDSKGKGKLTATFDTKTKAFDYTLTFVGLTGPATAAHIHGPATRAQSAGVVAPLGDKNPASPVTGSVTLTDGQVKMLQSAKLYVNVHTAANPGGEIRGQIIAAHGKRARKRASGAAATPAAPSTSTSASDSPAAAPK